MTAQELFEEKQHVVIAAIKQQFGSITRARQIAKMNNMELDDLMQVGHMYLWEHCVKSDPERVDTFNAYVMKGMKWAMSDEIHLKGTPFKISRRVSYEDRNKMNIHSIDLHREEEAENGFYAVSPINVEKEVMVSVGIHKYIGRRGKNNYYACWVWFYRTGDCCEIRDEKIYCSYEKDTCIFKNESKL